MPDKIFISYRRDDVPGDARGIRDALVKAFGRNSVFMDVDNLLIGLRFDEELAKALDECSLLIAVIGPRWSDLLKARAASGERDYVREEIAAALHRRIKVIPVRVGGEGRMPPLPAPADLPDDIRDLVLYQKQDVSHEHFGRDMADFIAGLRRLRKLDQKPLSLPLLASSGLAALLLAYASGAWVAGWPPFGAGSDAVTSDTAGRNFPPPGGEGSRVGGDQSTTSPLSPHPTPPRQGEGWGGAAADATAVAKAAAAQQVADQQAAEERRKADAAAEAARKADEEAPRQKAEAERQRLAELTRPGTEFDDCNSAGWCPKMVVVPAKPDGFMMGSPKGETNRYEDEDDTPGAGGKQVRVTIAGPFAVGRFEVTNAQYVRFLNAVKRRGTDKEPWFQTKTEDSSSQITGTTGKFAVESGKDDYPVVNVSFFGAKAYVEWLSKETGETYRLLSEAEWEYAARAGTKTAYHWGDSFNRDKANNGSGTVQVGRYDANEFGLHDMHGNVWEWVEDCYHDSYKGAPTDGSANATGSCGGRVLRGGSWYDIPGSRRSAVRNWGTPVNRDSLIGFRVARSVFSPRTR